MSMQNKYSNDMLHEPAFHKRPPHNPYEPNTNGCVSNSYGVFAIPFPIGYPGLLAPYAKGAMGFREMDGRFQHASYFASAIHLTLSALQLTGSGTPVFKGRKGTNAARDAQMAYIRAIENRATKEDRKLLTENQTGKGIRQDFMFDQSIAETIHAIVSGAFNAAIGRDENGGHGARGGGRDYDDDDLEDGVNVEVHYGEEDRRGGGRRRGGRRNEEEDDEQEDAEEAENETDRLIRQLLNDQLETHEGLNIIEKVKIIFVHYTRQPRDDEGRVIPGAKEEDAGCIMFGFIMDPLYSLGKNFASVIEMCEEHSNMKMGLRAGSGVVDSEIPAQRQRYAAGGGKTSRLMEHFPWLNSPEHATNSLLNLNKSKYLDLVSFVRDDPSLMFDDRQAAMLRSMEDPGSGGDPNPLHPLNVFTPAWAIRVMQQCGVSSRKCSMAVLKGDPHWDARMLQSRLRIQDIPESDEDEDDDEDEDGNPRRRVPPAQQHREDSANRWYVPPNDSYHYLMEGAPWAKNGYAGLHGQYFPWIEVPEQLLRMAAQRCSGNSLALYEGNSGNNVFSTKWTEAMMREGVGIVQPLPVVPYDPNALVRHSAIIQVAEENGRVMAQLKAPRDPKNQPEEYKLFCRDLDDFRSACMMRALNVLTPDAHINESTKIILTYMAREVRRVSSFLPHYDWNPFNAVPKMLELDSFAQFMIRESLDIAYSRHVVGQVRAWQSTHYGVQDCHSTTNVDMHYSVIYHGPPEAGKSFVVKDSTVKSCIPDSVTTMLESSTRAFNTHDDVSGCIFFKDEVDDIYVNAKAAERDRTGAAERLKTMLTDHKTTYRVLVFVDQSNGRSRRMAEDIESLFHATFACATNKKCSGGDEAIVSRFLNFVMTKADCNLYDYLGLNSHLDDEDTQYNNHLVHAWRIKQGLLCISQVLIDARVIPEPSMDVYSKIQSKFFSYLGHQGVDTSKIRGTQMTQRLARIYVILNGLIQLYDVPGAKYFQKEFDMNQLIDLIPYLYCTKQIAIFALTQTSEIFIHPTRVIALHAAFLFSKFPYVPGKTLEQYYKEDTERRYPWRIDNASDKEKAMVNFNYIAINGKYKDIIIAGIAEHCEPKLGLNETDSVISEMSKTFVRVHKMQPVFRETYLNTDPKHFVPKREDEATPIPVIHKNYSEECIYVAIEALGQLDEDLLINAFGSCLHVGFRPQKFLLGLHVVKPHPHPNKEGAMHHYNHVYRTVEITPEIVEDCSLTPAFTVPDVSYIPPLVRQMMSGASRHPDRAFNGEKYSTNRVKRTKANVEIEEDLDDWGHELHHYRSGCAGSHLASPSRQVTVYNNIRQELAHLERKHNLNDRSQQKVTIAHERALFLDYPNELLLEVDRGLMAQEEGRFNSSINKTVTDVYKAQMAAYQKMVTKCLKQNLPVPPAPKMALLAKRSNNMETFKNDYQHLLTGKPKPISLALTSHQQQQHSSRLTEMVAVDEAIADGGGDELTLMSLNGNDYADHARRQRAKDCVNPTRPGRFTTEEMLKKIAKRKMETPQDKRTSKHHKDQNDNSRDSDMTAYNGEIYDVEDDDGGGGVDGNEYQIVPASGAAAVEDDNAMDFLLDFAEKRTKAIKRKGLFSSNSRDASSRLLASSLSNSGWIDDVEPLEAEAEDDEDDY